MEEKTRKQAAGPVGVGTFCQRKPEVLHSSVGDTVLALHADTGDSYSFEGPSGRIWALLENPVSPAGMAAILSTEFKIDQEECANQVCSYCNRLFREDVIAIVDSSD